VGVHCSIYKGSYNTSNIIAETVPGVREKGMKERNV
jgi:hypothetical protein